METQETPFYTYDSYADPSEDLVNLDVNEGTDYNPSRVLVEEDSPNPYIDRRYLIVNISDLTDKEYDNCRKNNSGTKMVVRWNGDMPESFSSLSSTEGPYTREEIKTIMSNADWVEIMEDN